MERVVAGIDVSKSRLDVHLGRKDRTLPNDRDGFRSIAKWFRAAMVERDVLAATGRMHQAFAKSLHAKEFAVCVVDVACNISSSIHTRVGTSPRPPVSRPGPTESMHGCWPPSASPLRTCRRRSPGDGSRKGDLLGRKGCCRVPDSSDFPANRRRNSPGNQTRFTSA